MSEFEYRPWGDECINVSHCKVPMIDHSCDASGSRLVADTVLRSVSPIVGAFFTRTRARMSTSEPSEAQPSREICMLHLGR